MYERAQTLEFPFMAGSSLVVCHRSPYLEHPIDSSIEEAVAIGYSGLDICACMPPPRNVALDYPRS